MKFRSFIFVVDFTFLSLSNQCQSLVYKEIVNFYLKYCAQIHDQIRKLIKERKERNVKRFYRKITKQILYKIENLVIMY